MEQESPKENKKPKRPRIKIDMGKPIEIDPNEFIPNLATQKARKIKNSPLSLLFEIWFDKHLHDRQQIGDENGKREGIETIQILTLVELSLPHIIYYSLNIHGFSSLELQKRVCLRNIPSGNTLPLNVIIQIQFKELGYYEITIITAMSVDLFKLRDNQYINEITDNGSSILSLFSRGRINTICSI